MTKVLIPLALLLALAGLASWIFRKLDSNSPKRGPLPYTLKPLLSANERDYFFALRAAVGNDAIIFAQVPIGTFITVKQGTNENQIWRNRIDRKTVDFLLVHPQTLAPLVAIEVDDKSHQGAKRIQRDEFVNEVLATVQLPLRRFPARSAYAPAEIRKVLYPSPRGGAGDTSPAS